MHVKTEQEKNHWMTLIRHWEWMEAHERDHGDWRGLETMLAYLYKVNKYNEPLSWNHN